MLSRVRNRIPIVLLLFRNVAEFSRLIISILLVSFLSSDVYKCSLPNTQNVDADLLFNYVTGKNWFTPKKSSERSKVAEGAAEKCVLQSGWSMPFYSCCHYPRLFSQILLSLLEKPRLDGWWCWKNLTMRHKEVDENVCTGERRIKSWNLGIVMTSLRQVPPGALKWYFATESGRGEKLNISTGNTANK